MKKETEMLDMINKVQMFQIACNKVNKNLEKKKKDPVFDLKANQSKSIQEQDDGDEETYDE